MGLMGALLGLEKDQPQQVLDPAYIALSGRLPQTHWHKTKLRKDPPAPLPLTVKKSQKGSTRSKHEKATLIAQEWLLNPYYTIWVSIPEPYLTELEQRLKERRWHFQPCLGLSEMMADLTYLGSDDASLLPEGVYESDSIFPKKDADLDMNKILKREIAIHSLRMPHAVTSGRVFSHTSYFVERDARPIPVKTGKAFKAGNATLLFL